MSLFQFGFRLVLKNTTGHWITLTFQLSMNLDQEQQNNYDAVTEALEAAPEDEPPVKKHRGSSGKYTSYKAAN